MLECGFISLYRTLLQWEWYSCHNTTRVFIHLLLTANYELHKYQGKDILRGERICSRESLARELYMTENKLRTALRRLKSTNAISIKTDRKGTLISITNYDKYQMPAHNSTSKPPANNPSNTSKAPVCNKATKQKGNKEPSCAFIEFWQLYPKKQGKASAQAAWEKLAPDDALIAKIKNAINVAKTSQSWNACGGQYIPMPQTWLNAKRWEDEMEVQDGDTSYSTNASHAIILE